MEDWHLIGPDYDKTLIAWFENFDSGWDPLKAKYGERFYRLWKYYLLYRKSETGNEQLQVSPEWALRVGDMDGKINIHGPQDVPGAIQSLIDQHDPTADHH
jgi:hypothetical protein